MEKDQDKEIDEISEEIAKEIGYPMNSVEDEVLRDREQPQSGSRNKPFIFACAIIVVLIVFATLLLSENIKRSLNSEGEFDQIQAKILSIENRLANLESITQKVAIFEKFEKDAQLLASKRNEVNPASPRTIKGTYKRAISSKIPEISKVNERKISPVTQEKPTKKVSAKFYVIRPGDSLYLICLKNKISLDELCRLNNVKPNQIIFPGQKLRVK